MEEITRRRITITLNTNQFRNLENLMNEDNQTNFTYYFIYLIQQEKRNRQENKTSKKPVGRPKKEEDNNFYPAPYAGGGLYTREELEGYYEFRGEAVPPLPEPLTSEEKKKYNQNQN